MARNCAHPARLIANLDPTLLQLFCAANSEGHAAKANSDEPVAEMRRIYNVIQARGMGSRTSGLIAKGDYEGALASIDKELELDPGRDAAFVEKAQVYLAQNDVPAAVDALATAIKMNPKTYNQILRDDEFNTLWDDPGIRRSGTTRHSICWRRACRERNACPCLRSHKHRNRRT